jgi:glycosyltransferase involved in cell wall biosynthesis
VVPGIGYASGEEEVSDPRANARRILASMRDAWGRHADILHVHNATLNKNPGLLACLRHLQDEGIHLFLQIHDLAEDGRPSVAYRPEEGYPQDCHYGVINTRDRDALLHAGLLPEGLHLMFNEVRPIEPRGRESSPTGPRALLYPVRAIRRKNLGEAILLSLLLPADLVVTLAPSNAADRALYEDWKGFSLSRHLQVTFDAGRGRDLSDLLAGADAAVTTSVNEGFGFAFLEPFTAGRAVLGRRVPHVCRDFEAAGLRFPSLYGSLPVQLSTFDASAMATRWGNALKAYFTSFERNIDEREVRHAWKAITKDGLIDFAFLDEPAQREAILRVHESGAEREKVLQSAEAHADLRTCLGAPDEAMIARNRELVLLRFGASAYAALLEGIYARVLRQSVSQAIDRAALLETFLRPERFRMLEQR